MILLMMPITLGDIHEAHKIRIDISAKIFGRITHTGIAYQAHHSIDLMRLKERLQSFPRQRSHGSQHIHHALRAVARATFNQTP